MLVREGHSLVDDVQPLGWLCSTVIHRRHPLLPAVELAGDEITFDGPVVCVLIERRQHLDQAGIYVVCVNDEYVIRMAQFVAAFNEHSIRLIEK
ncbi:hypothetical protein [Natrarchaeobius oligotrophus]|uniref:hypothetical protein n=1 Tax=Natrarchaeobius oligotrophus TaxID=3455743 RepID=UPI000F527080|nr:hypothetical protein [Natrarchaeobius chitinivorans]